MSDIIEMVHDGVATYVTGENVGMDVGVDIYNSEIDFDIYRGDWDYLSTSLNKAQATHLRDHLTGLIDQMDGPPTK